MNSRTGARPKPYTLSFRLRSPKHTLSTYQEVYMLLRVGQDKKVAAVTGYRVERANWLASPFRFRNGKHLDVIEERLDAIRDKIDSIYRYQARKAQIEGWRMTTRSVLRQFQGKPFVLVNQAIRPCLSSWKASFRRTIFISTGRAAVYA